MRHWRSRGLAGLLLLAGLLTSGCAGLWPGRPGGREPGFRETGIASWYGPGFHGKRTANGEVYDMHAMTAAHKKLPFDTVVEVTNRDNGKRVRVRINDRGPFIRGRVIDLSRAAAEAIDMIGPGTAKVGLRILRPGDGARPNVAYRVQLGAFEEGHRAEALWEDARRVDPKAKVRFDGRVFRVEVGPFKKRGAADDAKRRFTRRGFEAVLLTGPA